LLRDFDRVTAERDALQQRLNAADQRIDELERDKHRLDALESNCWDVRFDSSPNGDAGDSSIKIEVVGHWMDQPLERVIGENYSENLRAAIDQAMAAPAYPPARPEYPEPEPDADADWHMNPCKQGHRDVGASGGVAACNQCDEKIEAATTQEAFERWNATHPVVQPIPDQLRDATNMIDALQPERIKGMIETVGGEHAVMIDPENGHYGWTFKKHPDGQWVSGRKATEREMIAARSHAQITNQL